MQTCVQASPGAPLAPSPTVHPLAASPGQGLTTSNSQNRLLRQQQGSSSINIVKALVDLIEMLQPMLLDSLWLNDAQLIVLAIQIADTISEVCSPEYVYSSHTYIAHIVSKVCSPEKLKHSPAIGAPYPDKVC